jgi:CRP-like cAMP-binding protein
LPPSIIRVVPVMKPAALEQSQTTAAATPSGWPTRLETIAVRARSHAIAAGTVIIREGDPGDTFYVIDAGTVEVEHGETRLCTHHEGSYFGEIALLHDIRRTATVRAIDRVSVLAIDSEEFLAAVNTYPHSRRAAEHTVSTRLGTTSPQTPTPSGA